MNKYRHTGAAPFAAIFFRAMRFGAVLVIAGLLFSLTACSGGQAEYERIESFEYHFYPEEYDGACSPAPVVFSLKENTDHQFRIDAACESGAMEIGILYGDEEVKSFAVHADTPCNELLTVPANTAAELTVTVSIGPDTKGEVIGALLAPTK